MYSLQMRNGTAQGRPDFLRQDVGFIRERQVLRAGKELTKDLNADEAGSSVGMHDELRTERCPDHPAAKHKVPRRNSEESQNAAGRAFTDKRRQRVRVSGQESFGEVRVISLQRSSDLDSEHLAMKICDLLYIAWLKLSNAVQGPPRLTQVSLG